MLTGNGSGAGQLRYGLRAKSGDAAEDTATTGGEFAMAAKLGSDGAQSVEEGDGFFDQPGERGRLRKDLHDK